MKRVVCKAQNVSRMCMVCGVENRLGLSAHFYEVDGGELVGVFTPGPEHQSYPGRMHGGVIAAILDETIGRAVNISDPDAWGVTVELSLRFRKPVPLDGPVKAVARITGEVRRLFEGTGEIVLADGSVAAEAQGRYVRLPLDRIADTEFVDREWFGDPIDAPDVIDV